MDFAYRERNPQDVTRQTLSTGKYRPERLFSSLFRYLWCLKLMLDPKVSSIWSKMSQQRWFTSHPCCNESTPMFFVYFVNTSWKVRNSDQCSTGFFFRHLARRGSPKPWCKSTRTWTTCRSPAVGDSSVATKRRAVETYRHWISENIQHKQILREYHVLLLK